MRLAATAILAALAVAAPAAAVQGDWATASASGSTVSLRLHYLMTCGQPGPGPLVVRLPAAFGITNLRVTVRGAERPALHSGSALTITLPKPPEVTCMSIGEGTLPVTIANVHAAAGSYVVTARVRNHAFTAGLRIR